MCLDQFFIQANKRSVEEPGKDPGKEPSTLELRDRNVVGYDITAEEGQLCLSTEMMVYFVKVNNMDY